MATIPSIGEVLRDALTRVEPRRFPPRVRAAIRLQENGAEILVKLIQLTVVGIWGALYLASPKPELASGFSPVPLALSAYLVLNLIGLAWALRLGLPDWAVYVNIVIDVSMLMILIWSFHVQYGQPPSFYLKAPTLLYIFIFIAVRALRFQARFVIATGIVAALGWLTMTAYVVFSDPTNTMITRNYVDYMTSNSVLIGAEIDKIISILVVSLILGLAIRRAHRLLVRATAESVAARDLSRFFDQSVAEKIRSSEQIVEPGQGVRRDAAILFVDIRGFTVMAAPMKAGDVVALLTAYEERIVALIQQNGGTIDKFLGDGIMATFGAVVASETFAADALCAVDAIMADVQTWHEDEVLHAISPHRINAAVASGAVVFGALGGADRLEYTTVGTAVNLAAKLEKHNKTAETFALCDSETFARARRQGYRPDARLHRFRDCLEAVDEEIELVRLWPRQADPSHQASRPLHSAGSS